MNDKTKINKVLKLMKQKRIKDVQLWFTDILGYLKCVTITDTEVYEAMTHGKGFDGSSITGFAEAEESDIIARADADSFTVLPWEGKETPVGRMFCDILNPDGTPYPGDPRYALKRQVERARKMGYTFYVGPELEFFYFKMDGRPEVVDEGKYFDVIPNDLANSLRKRTTRVLESMGIQIEASHHEVAPSQHEIDLKYDEAMIMADKVMTYKMVVKEIAQQSGVHATFMPKPLFGVCGSGMHVHQSLFKGKRNAFFDRKDKYGLSKIAKQYIAGQLKHAFEMSSVLGQWVNSYKRLVPGYEAPVYISWARRNRTALIRVPYYKPGHENATRVELRCPDPACNPYLAFAVMLAAGLEGIEKKYQIPDPVEPNIYKMEVEEKERRGLKSLPGDLFEALKASEKSKIVKEALGEHIFPRFIHNKAKEWEDFRIRISSYEIEKYLNL